MLQSGSTIGGIRIDALLGRGAMGEVYRGVQLSLKRPVAVKRIAEHLLGDAEAATRFTREAQVVARVQSPYVVAVYDFGRHRDEHGVEHGLLVMELVDGGASLRALLAARGRAFDWRTATALILHVAEGLAAAAEFGVVHRDIKPDNIMVTAKGTAKLADFGLAKSVDSSAMTLEGAVLGTPLYLPPEACRGEPVDARGDLYSLGCTWFHLLAGRPPFQAASTVALLRAHLDDAPPDLRSLATDVPEAIASLVMRLLAKQPDQRLPSAQALVDALHGLAAKGLIIPRAVPEALAELRDAFWQAPRLPLLPGGEADLRNAIYAAVRADMLRLVDADGATVAVDTAESINLSSQGRRLAKPLPAEPCAKCGKDDCDGSCETKPDVCDKCGKAGCDGTCDQVCAICGKTGCGGTCQDEQPPAQRSIKFTLAHEVDDAHRAQIIEVVGALYAALMSEDVTFIQGTTEIVTTPESADAIAEAAKALGIKPTTRDV